jgi:hypothetical protein
MLSLSNVRPTHAMRQPGPDGPDGRVPPMTLSVTASVMWAPNHPKVTPGAQLTTARLVALPNVTPGPQLTTVRQFAPPTEPWDAWLAIAPASQPSSAGRRVDNWGIWPCP